MISDKSGDFSKVVLLGASGRLGQILRACWPDSETLISHSRYERSGFVAFDQCLEPEKAIVAMQGAAAVVSLSGITPAHAAQSGDCLTLNVDLGLAAVHAAHAAGVGRVFLSSTAAIYGRAGGVQYEHGPCEPVSEYGRAKLNMERAALSLARELNQPITILRIGNVAGADAILGSWRKGMQIDQLSDGTTPRRSYIGPETLTRVIHTLTQLCDLPDVINIAAPGAIYMGDLLDATDLTWFPRPASNDIIANVELSTKRLERYLDFAPQNGTAVGMVAEWRRLAARVKALT